MNAIKGIPGVVYPEDKGRNYEWNQLHYGMFIHFGLYSLLGGKWKNEPVTEGYSEQIQMWADIPADEYEKLMDEFTIENLDVEKIVSLAKESGMKYLVITSKHHDGFCLFDTKTTDYNVVQSTPFKKDIIKLFADECERQGLKFVLYYSLVDWHAGHEYDYNNNNLISPTIEKLIKIQLTELMTNYGEISEIWFDMSHPTKNQSKEFVEIVRKFQPKAAINGRIWNNMGGFRTLGDNQIPTEHLEGLWQTPASIYNETWSYREWQEHKGVNEKAKELLEHLISIRARGGNYLLNIGPKGDGSLVQYEAEVLEKMGEWLNRHPSAILGSLPTRFPKQSWGEITYRDENLYLHIFDVPADGILKLKGLSSVVKYVIEDGGEEGLKWIQEDEELVIHLPTSFSETFLPTIKVSLAEELFIKPKNIVKKSAEGWTVTPKKIENHIPLSIKDFIIV